MGLFTFRKKQIPPPQGKVNRGTLQDTAQKANAYWLARNLSQQHDPFILYAFPTAGDARKALLSLSFIEENAFESLVCLKDYHYGYYLNENGVFEAIIAGKYLELKDFEAAKISFQKNNGVCINEHVPDVAGDELKAVTPSDLQPTGVTLKESYKKPAPLPGYEYEYLIYSGESEAAAMDFLQNQPPPPPLRYLIVETPDGNFCRDNMGTYKE